MPIRDQDSFFLFVRLLVLGVGEEEKEDEKEDEAAFGLSPVKS